MPYDPVFLWATCFLEKMTNFADQAFFPNVSRGFNFADDCEADISRDKISRIFADLAKIREIREI